MQTLSFTSFNQSDVYTLSYNGSTTSNITYYGNPTFEAAAIQAALNQVLGANFVTVAPATMPNAFLVTFAGLGTTNPAALITGTDGTTTAATVAAAITTNGAPPAANSAVAQLLASNQIVTTSSVTVNSDGRFDLNNFSQQIAELTVNGGTVTTGAGASGGSLTVTGAASITDGTLLAPGANSTFVFQGSLTLTGSTINLSGSGSVLQLGSTLTAGSDTASGATVIEGQGTLALGSTSQTFNVANNTGLADSGDVIIFHRH